MNDIGIVIVICITIMFGPPLLFLIIGMVKRNTNKEMAKLFFILAAAWLMIGGGICASMMIG